MPNSKTIVYDDDGYQFEKPVNLATGAKVSKAVQINPGAIKAPGSKPPDEVSYGALELPAWEFGDEAVEGNEESISCSIKLPNDMDKTVAPILNIGWATAGAGAGNVEFELTYVYRALNEDMTAGAQDTITTTSAASATAKGKNNWSSGNMEAPDTTDGSLHLKLKRKSSTANDTIAAVITLLGMTFHYTSNKLGTIT